MMLLPHRIDPVPNCWNVFLKGTSRNQLPVRQWRDMQDESRLMMAPRRELQRGRRRLSWNLDGGFKRESLMPFPHLLSPVMEC